MSSSHTRQSSLPRSLAAPLCHPRMLIAHSRVSRLDFFFFSFVCQSFLINFLHPQLVCNHLIKNLKLLTITLLSRLSGVALSLSRRIVVVVIALRRRLSLLLLLAASCRRADALHSLVRSQSR